MKLYSYWRSGTSYRVRLALALKEAECEIVPINLLQAAHQTPAFKSKNPQGLVPALELDDGTILSQSPAIIEYLDEILPGPKLFPESPVKRALTRQMAALVGCDIHPLQNLRVLKYIQDPLQHEREEAFAWAQHWISVGFEALEELAERVAPGAPYLIGDTMTAAECYLLPQLYGARRFGVDLSAFPRLIAVENAVLALPSVQKAHPSAQPDATE